MGYFIAGLALLGSAFLLFGFFTGKSDNADEAFSAIIPYMIGAALLAGDAVIFLVYVAYRALSK